MTTISIDLNNVVKLEDVRLQEVNSVETYIKELEWFKGLIDGHIYRCERWKDDVPTRPGFDKLHEFLSQLED
jgi:hypothetical protein